MKSAQRRQEDENQIQRRGATSLDEALGEVNPFPTPADQTAPRPEGGEPPKKQDRIKIEKEEDGRERIIEDASSPQQNYVDLPMDQEIANAGDLFGPEESEAAQEPVEDEAFDPAKQPIQVSKKKRRRWYGVPVGIFMLLMAAVGLVFLGTQAYHYIYKIVTDDSVERAYDTFLEPVVMLDPQPFESLEGADKKMLLQASVWCTVFREMGQADLQYDNAARMIIPADMINESARKLFGPNCVLNPANITITGGSASESPQTTIEYVEEENAYHVPLPDAVGTYRPYTEKITRHGNIKYLRVAYRTSFDYSNGGANSQPEGAEDSNYTMKYLEYEITYDPATDSEYISAIRATE